MNDPADGGHDAIRFGAGAPGIERAEVRLTARAFDPHRHDTYAIGVTTSGVQVFGYRGERRVCLPGQVHVLHPDEMHDGGPGTEDGFGYRILYVAPELVRRALDGAELPFVREPVHPASPATRFVGGVLADIDDPITDLAVAEIATGMAETLCALAGRDARRPVGIDLDAVERVREYLAAHAAQPTTAATLERIAGTDRFTLTRHFRRAFGTTPDRYRTLRRLGIARTAIERGLPLARVAAESGFADQSHMTRQFRRAYGMTPARWAALTAASRSAR